MFDGPQRAIRCAMAIRDAVQALGIEVRAGLHTGECEVRGDDIGGIAVHIGARVSALAGPNDVLVSSTLRDLVIGSGLEFEDRGAHQLKGVPGEWHLFAVASYVASVKARCVQRLRTCVCRSSLRSGQTARFRWFGPLRRPATTSAASPAGGRAHRRTPRRSGRRPARGLRTRSNSGR